MGNLIILIKLVISYSIKLYLSSLFSFERQEIRVVGSLSSVGFYDDFDGLLGFCDEIKP